jgi:AcrR family transcriptional regulator
VTTTPTRRVGRPVDLARKDRRREEILEAAGRLFAKRGYSETTTQVVADDLAVGKGTIYRYFPDKRSLFLAAAERRMQQLAATILASVEGISDPLERVAEVVHSYLVYFDAHPEFVELQIQERSQFKDRHKPTYFEYRDANIGKWHEVFRELIAADRIRNIPVERIADVISDLLYGTMFSNYFAGRRRSPEDQTRDILDLVFSGILSDTERAKRQAAKAAGQVEAR